MKNFWKILGIIALVAVIGFSMAACGGDDDDDGGGSDPEGTWEYNNGTYSVILVFDNGNVESKMVSPEQELPMYKGTYDYDGDKLYVTITDIYGGGLAAFAFALAGIDLDNKTWYSKDDLANAFDPTKSLYSQEEFDDILADMFSTTTYNYSIEDNKLTMTITDEDGEVTTVTYTKKE